MSPADGRRPFAPPRALSPTDGLLLVDKPGGMTSHDVVARIRRHLNFKKIGHGGTLDPQATGLLILLLGIGTKLSDRVMGGDKSYEGVLLLGVETDSYDLDGQVVAEADPTAVTESALRAAIAAREGDLQQIPPMVSAVKKDGVPLYKLARKGQTIEREPRLVHVYRFELLAFEPPRATFRLRCTKGTYVRTLCHEIGRELGCGACLERLRRTASGQFSLSEATPLADLMAGSRADLLARIMPLPQAILRLRDED